MVTGKKRGDNASMSSDINSGDDEGNDEDEDEEGTWSIEDDEGL